MLDGRVAAFRRRGVALPPPMVVADSWFSDSKLMRHVATTHQGTFLVEGKSTYTFALPDGRQVKGGDLQHQHDWPWRESPQVAGVRYARLRATSPTYGTVTLIVVSETRPTVCPSHDSANILSYQQLPMSISSQRGHSREAKRGSAGGHRIARILKRLGPFSSRVWPLGCPCSRWSAASVPRLGGNHGRPPCPSRMMRQAERTVESGIVNVPRALSVSPRAP